MAAAPERDTDELGLLHRAVHDLKNPLAVVRASLEWLEVELATASGDTGEAIRDATSATRRLMTIVDDLDILGRLDSAVTDARVDLESVFEAISRELSSGDRPKRLSVSCSVEKGARFEGDRVLFRRAIEALIDACARSAIPPVRVELGARIQSEGVDITVEIPDDGAKEGRCSVESALGVQGLRVALATRIVEAHGGTLEARRRAPTPKVIVRLPKRISR